MSLSGLTGSALAGPPKVIAGMNDVHSYYTLSSEGLFSQSLVKDEVSVVVPLGKENGSLIVRGKLFALDAEGVAKAKALMQNVMDAIEVVQPANPPTATEIGDVVLGFV